MKKPERPWRSASEIDEDVIDYACEDACACGTCKHKVGKDIGKDMFARGTLPSAYKNTLRVPIYCVNQARECLLIVCGAIGPTA